MSYYMSLHTIYAWNVWGGNIEKIVRFLTSKLASRFDGRSQAPASWPRWVSVGWPEEDGDDRNNEAERANIITRWHKTSSSGWLPYLPAGGPAERGSVHGIWSLWRRRSLQVCTAFLSALSELKAVTVFVKSWFLFFPILGWWEVMSRLLGWITSTAFLTS